MLTALVLICSMTTTPDLATCSGENAQSVIRVPQDYGNPAACLMHGQAYLAETELGQELAVGERVKVICAPTRRAADFISHTAQRRTRSE